MSRFPKIESHCPMAPEELEGLNGHCHRCNTTVHSLDGMSDGERATFMRKATGKVCVTYTVAASVAAVMALSMVGPARATDTPTSATSTPASQQTTSRDASDNEPKTGTLIRDKTKNLEPVVVLGGAVHTGNETQWVDDDNSAQDLPVVREQDSGTH